MDFQVLLEDPVLLDLREEQVCLDRMVVLEMLDRLDQRALRALLDNRVELEA